MVDPTRWVVLDDTRRQPIKLPEPRTKNLLEGQGTLLEGRDLNTRARMPEGWQIKTGDVIRETG